MFARRTILMLLGALPLVAVAARPAWASKSLVFAPDGIAIHGYDPVAYFTQKMAVVGQADFEATWNGATWRFATAANREMFLAAPETYAPQYGGYCAYAVAHGATAKTDPDAWTVHNGRLYLNYSDYVRAQWRVDPDGFIAKANANWPAVLER